MKKTATLIFMFCSLNLAAQSQITWITAANVAASTSGNEHPRVVMDASGNPLVLWGNANRAMFSRWNGTAFTTPVMLNPMSMTIAEANWMGPDIASHGDTVYVVFKQSPEADTTSHIYIVRSFDAGLTFSTPVRVEYIGDSISRFPAITTDDIGNPIVGFMKFDPSFGDSRWVVSRSNDFGSSFSADIKASGWSSATSTVCDCCPGAIVSSGNNVAMLYRDNNSNLRDSWAGLSTNGGASFSGGWNIDQNSWTIFSCPATGPDGIIIGDSLYSVFASGVGGMRVHRSASSLSNISVALSQQITGTVPGLTLQNFPRIANFGTAVAMVWKQFVSGADQLPVYFTSDISNGFPANYDTVDLANITNADVAVGNGKITVVWEDDNSGTVKCRSGNFTPVITSVNEVESNDFLIYPNPTANQLEIFSKRSAVGGIEIFDMLGKNYQVSVISGELVKPQQVKGGYHLTIDISSLKTGVYFFRFYDKKGIYQEVRKIMLTSDN